MNTSPQTMLEVAYVPPVEASGEVCVIPWSGQDVLVEEYETVESDSTPMNDSQLKEVNGSDETLPDILDQKSELLNSFIAPLRTKQFLGALSGVEEERYILLCTLLEEHLEQIAKEETQAKNEQANDAVEFARMALKAAKEHGL